MAFLLELAAQVLGALLWWLFRRPLRFLARIFGLRWLWRKVHAFGQRGYARNGWLWPIYVTAVLLILAGVAAVLVFVLVA